MSQNYSKYFENFQFLSIEINKIFKISSNGC